MCKLENLVFYMFFTVEIQHNWYLSIYRCSCMPNFLGCSTSASELKILVAQRKHT